MPPPSFSGSKNLKLVAAPLSDSALPTSAATPFAWVGFLRALSHTRPLRPFLTQDPTRVEGKTLAFSGTSLSSAPSSLLVRNRGGRGRKKHFAGSHLLLPCNKFSLPRDWKVVGETFQWFIFLVDSGDLGLEKVPPLCLRLGWG